jgi:ferredoxin
MARQAWRILAGINAYQEGREEDPLLGRESADFPGYVDSSERGSVPERARRLPAGSQPWGLEEAMMRVVVDYERCESNAVCMDILPEVFEVRDDNFLYVLNERPAEEHRDKVMEAVRSCPKRAISVVDD